MEANNAAMREALEKAKKAICHHAEHICQSLSWENSNIQSNCADVLCAHRELCEAKTAINAALSEPDRQFNVGTPEEQWKRFDEFCISWQESGPDGGCSAGCPCMAMKIKESDGCFGRSGCFAYWAQMPYEAEEGAVK